MYIYIYTYIVLFIMRVTWLKQGPHNRSHKITLNFCGGLPMSTSPKYSISCTSVKDTEGRPSGPVASRRKAARRVDAAWNSDRVFGLCVRGTFTTAPIGQGCDFGTQNSFGGLQ